MDVEINVIVVVLLPQLSLLGSQVAGTDKYVVHRSTVAHTVLVIDSDMSVVTVNVETGVSSVTVVVVSNKLVDV